MKHIELVQTWLNDNWNVLKQRILTPIRATVQPISDYVYVNGCRYRVDGDPDNMAMENCCFVGITVSPELYSRYGEGAVVSYLPGLLSPTTEGDDVLIMGGDEYFDIRECIREFQHIHDKLDPETWPMAVTKWANEHGLTLPEPLI